jgi:hypothetical protein
MLKEEPNLMGFSIWCLARVVRRLQPQPELPRRPETLAQPLSDMRTDGAPLSVDLRDLRRRHADLVGDSRIP